MVTSIERMEEAQFNEAIEASLMANEHGYSSSFGNDQLVEDIQVEIVSLETYMEELRQDEVLVKAGLLSEKFKGEYTEAIIQVENDIAVAKCRLASLGQNGARAAQSSNSNDSAAASGFQQSGRYEWDIEDSEDEDWRL
ncbi:hypothetical protein ACH42_01825 [Endozoicomonas sp. (ex Bugula neritina AB1)]|nr:hypothetical protein ACH42_01825 [Endozoicomonas sp. (ex Bugula neritina AB1)]